MNVIIPLKTAKELKKAIRFFALGCTEKSNNIKLSKVNMKTLKTNEKSLYELLEFEKVLNDKIKLYENN